MASLFNLNLASILKMNFACCAGQTLSVIFVCVMLASGIAAAPSSLRVAILATDDAGMTLAVMKRLTNQVRESSAKGAAKTDYELVIVDADLARAAARGAGWAGSTNLTLAEARDVGASVGCDFFFLVKAETVRRSSFAKPMYFETNARVMLINANTGKLVLWDFLINENASACSAQTALTALIDAAGARYRAALFDSARDEQTARATRIKQVGTLPAPAPLLIDDATNENLNVRVPQPYRRLRPAYPPSAARAEAEATIDAEVDIDSEGNVTKVEIVRWGGFGLDEETTNTIKRMSFRPAMQNGAPVASRVLVRYNFKRPEKIKSAGN